MILPKSYADVDVVREITHNLYPEAQNISIIDHNADNIVALVDANCAVRFPRGEAAYLRGLHEKYILRRLESITTIAIPHIVDEHADPPYIITSFVHGRHINPTTIRTLSKDHQEAFSKNVAQFAYTMHTSFSLDDELPLRKELRLDEPDIEEPWAPYFKRVIQGGHLPNPVQNEIAKRCYDDWVELCDVAPTVVVHDDLHTENLMFDEDSQLIGVIDFGDVKAGMPEQELRQLYRISEEAMLAGVREYERLSGHSLNVDAVKIWAIMKELADYSNKLKDRNTIHHSFKRTSRNLNAWFPEGEWGKGYTMAEVEGNQ
jgi:aminoglycoside phosphotransferase (APT) family kinase protein